MDDTTIKFFKGLFVVVLLVVVGGGGLWLLSRVPGLLFTSQSEQPAPIDSPNFNGGSVDVFVPGEGISPNTPSPVSAPTLSVATADGGVLSVQDFSSTTVRARASADTFYLAGEDAEGLKEGAAYSMYYLTDDQSFTVTILEEPIAQVRIDAETYLQQKLGLTRNDMCRLRYVVLVPASVSQFYTGQNLGFSFCPGAVPLQ